jgi:uroporphyrin-III C-methyltransferase
MNMSSRLPASPSAQNRSGTPHVYFVGAGPGDPDLLTVRAHNELRRADIVLYDALVGDAILELIPAHAQRFPVGKRAGLRSIAQSEINRMLVRSARPGFRLVRLKGGDPAIFGRLGEEIAALEEAGIAFTIVPGITAASAAAAASGISLTLRGSARRVQFVTAHARGDEALELDWPSLADPAATTVFYMARQSAALIAERLMAHGLKPNTPVLLMSDVSQECEMRLGVPLSRMPEAVKAFPPAVPLIILVGTVTRAARRSRSASPSLARQLAPA